MWELIDPFEELKRMREKMDKVLREIEKGKKFPSIGDFLNFPVDVIDEGDKLRMIAELPGFKKENIEISIEDRYISIKAERDEEKEEEGKEYLRRERSYGKTQRKILLPSEINPDKVKATYINGILDVTLPKVEVKTRRKINIE